MTTEQLDYGYEELRGIPPEMGPWQMIYGPSQPTPYGQYVLVGCEMSPIEQHHQIIVLDENGAPLPGIEVMFGFSTGNSERTRPTVMYWNNPPTDPKGNRQVTNASGYAQHTVGPDGGENLYVWDVQGGELRLSSPVVYNCLWQGTPPGTNNHTCVKLTFQRRQEGIIPQGNVDDQQNSRLDALEQQMNLVMQDRERGYNV